MNPKEVAEQVAKRVCDTYQDAGVEPWDIFQVAVLHAALDVATELGSKALESNSETVWDPRYDPDWYQIWPDADGTFPINTYES